LQVLVVDDYAVIRRGLQVMCRALGNCKIVGEAESGEQAVMLAIRLHPDVVLMDIRLPGLDGIEATRLINAALPDTAVLILTGLEDPNLKQAALQAGARAFFRKDDLTETLLGQTFSKIQTGESFTAA
jgi:DNA-binding NarL/FixJ family response regulator